MTLNDRPPLNEAGWAGRRVLVTGANGFVGHWLVRALNERGAFVAAFIRSASGKTGSGKTGSLPFPEGIEIVRGEVTDLGLISQAVADLQIDTVYQLAASNVNTGAQISPYEVFESNLRGVYTVLEAARVASRPVRVVVASSKEVEDCFSAFSGRKFHPYMTSKAAAEMITRAYSDTYGLPAAILRSENIYGGGDFNWNRLIPSVIRSILQGQIPVIRGDGLVRRDYVYVEDAVAAYLALGLRLEDPALKGKLFRIATGSSASVLEVVKEVMRVAGLEGKSPQVLNQPSDSRVDVPYDPVFERAALGWQNQYSLAMGLQKTWEWYQNHHLGGKQS